MESNCFPEGLGILVVDHDPQGLDSLHKMLLECKYKATICNSAQDALALLDTQKDGFDLILGDVKLPDMDGFEFLQKVGCKTDIPVIMMCDEGETSNVMKGVKHGACDCLVKPVRLKEIRNIWQHAFRKRMHTQDDNNTVVLDPDPQHTVVADPDPTPLNKKPRVVWTDDLHLKFVNAIHCIGGLEEVGPKKILDLMGEPLLTREHVASHLQKYRISVSRKKKEDELKAKCSGMNLPEYSHQNIVMNHNNNNNNQNDTSIICATPNDTSICAMPMVANQQMSYTDQAMEADQRWEYIDQPIECIDQATVAYIDQQMVADQRWEYIDQPIEYIDQATVAGQGIMEYIDQPAVAYFDQQMVYSNEGGQRFEYSDPKVEVHYNWSTEAQKMEATQENLFRNSINSYAFVTDSAPASNITHPNVHQHQNLEPSTPLIVGTVEGVTSETEHINSHHQQEPQQCVTEPLIDSVPADPAPPDDFNLEDLYTIESKWN